MISVIGDVLKNEVTRPGMQVYKATPEAAAVMVKGIESPNALVEGTLIWALSIWNGDPMQSPVYIELHSTSNHIAVMVPLVHDARARTWIEELMNQKAVLEPMRTQQA